MSDNAFVFVLSLIKVHHGNGHQPEHEIVGVYASKAAAVTASGSVETYYGTFDEAIECDYEEDHIDNTEDPPDDGCLLQIGSYDTGEGDYVELNISKFPLITESPTTVGSKAKTKKSKPAKKARQVKKTALHRIRHMR